MKSKKLSFFLRGYLFLIIVLLQSAAVFSQITYSESFDGATFAPTGWTATINSGSYNWARTTSGSNPSVSPHSGAGMSWYYSFLASSGSNVSLITPVISYANRGAYTPTISFWMYRDNGYSGYLDKVDAYVNTSASLAGATLLGTVNRSRSQAPTTASDGWYQYSYNIPAGFTGATNYIILKATSALGNNIFIDDVSWTEPCPPTVPVPTGLTTTVNSCSQITASWTAASQATSYQLNVATDSLFTNIIYTNAAVAGVSQAVTGLNTDSTYYFRVKTNITGCGSSSFTTYVSDVTVTSTPVGSAATNITCGSFTANWSAVSGATGYYLDVATDASFTTMVGGYSNLNVGNVLTYSITGLSPYEDYYYRVRSVGCIGATNSSIPIVATTASPSGSGCYCTPTFSGCASYYINSVVFSNISNTSGCSATYQFYTATTGSVNRGCSYTLNATGAGGTFYWSVWIDYNQDGDFSDAGENVYLYNSGYLSSISPSITIPASATLGTTRMRVRASWLTSINAGSYCTNIANNGETEDYLITISDPVTPSAPVANAGMGPTCTSFVANWNSVSNATGYLLDVSTVSNFASFVVGFNALSVGNVTSYNVTGLSASTTYYYRLRAGNCASSNSGYSSTITIATVAPCYCAAAATSPGSYYLTNVTFAGINNTTGAAAYTFYTSPYAILNTGCSFTLSITENSFSDSYRVWIDYNQNGAFEDAESVFNGTFGGSPGPRTASGSIAIPAGATIGSTRMRVMVNSSAIAVTGDCSNPGLGEVEDYLVTIGNGSTVPSAPTANAATSITCSAFSANWSSITGATGYYLDVATDAGFTSMVAGYNNLSVGNVLTYSLSGLSSGTTYYYRVRALSCGGTSVSSGSQTAAVVTGTTTTYTGAASGNWNLASNWSGSALPNSCSDVVIPSGKTVTVPAGYTGVCHDADISGTLIVASTGSLSISGTLTDQSTGVVSHTGASGSFTIGTLTALNSCNFNKTSTGPLTISTATFQPTSNFTFTGGSNQFDPHWNYGNLTFNDPSNVPSFGTTYGLNVQNDLTISSLASSTVPMSTTASLTHTIGRDLLMNSTNTSDILVVDNGTGTPTLNIGRNLVFATTAACGFRLNNSTAGTPTMNIAGDFTMNGTTNCMFVGSASTGNAVLNITGNINENGPGVIHITNDRGCTGCTIGNVTATVNNIIVGASGHLDLGYSKIGGNSTIYVLGSATTAGGIFAGPHGQNKTDGLSSTLIFKSPASGTVSGNLSMSKGDYEGGGGNCRIGSGYFNVQIQANRTITLQSDIEIGDSRTFVVDAGGTLITGTSGGTAYKIMRRTDGSSGASTGTAFTLSATSGGLYSTIDANSTDAAGALQASAYAGNIQTNTRTYSSTANYKFSATAAQLTGDFSTVTTPTANTVNKLIVNNTNATITTGLTLTNPVTITSDLQFIAGRFKTTTTNLPTVDVSGTSSGYGSTSANTAYVDGPIAKNSNSASVFLFPTGKSSSGGIYRAASVTPSTTTAVTHRAELMYTDPTTVGYNRSNVLAPVQWVEPNFYWDIIRTSATNVNTRVRLYYDNPDTSSLYDHTGVGQYLSSKWANQGGALGPTALFRSVGSVTALATIPTAVGNNPFTLVASTTPLPIELLSLTAADKVNRVDLIWKTASERNSDLFIIEKSKDGLVFESLASLKAGGNSTSIKNYSYADFTNESTVLYYRLRERDFDGKEQLSQIVSVNRSGQNSVTIRLSHEMNEILIDNLQESKESYAISLCDVLGRVILTGESVVSKENRRIEIPLKSMEPGIYFINIQNSSYKLSKKVLY